MNLNTTLTFESMKNATAMMATVEAMTTVKWTLADEGHWIDAEIAGVEVGVAIPLEALNPLVDCEPVEVERFRDIVAGLLVSEMVERAASAWTGITWDSGPALVARHMRQACVSSGDYQNRLLSASFQVESGVWWPNDGQESNQALTKAWKSLLRDIEDLFEDDDRTNADMEEARNEAERLAQAECLYVEAQAQAAAEHGRCAAEYITAGDWDMAVEHIGDAVKAEGQFGDSPTWQRVATYIAKLRPVDAADDDGEIAQHVQ